MLRLLALVAAPALPADAVTSSGSGLDPDVSPAYAEPQVHRVAERNGLPVARVEELVEELMEGLVEELVEERTEGRSLGFLGGPRVDVLELDVALRSLIGRG
ncbi:potassium-transporting ATPase subunit C [Streptomyces sp. NPDC057052]|uniref:potassium-transporting ATPase subunit C n=1 Tax=Streptomyces sp. NPDC057052 TaxID=3346010 RepID=UPI00362B8C1F